MRNFLSGLFFTLVTINVVGLAIVATQMPKNAQAKIDRYECKYDREKAVNRLKQQMLDAMWNRYRGMRDGLTELSDQGYADYTRVSEELELYKANNDCL